MKHRKQPFSILFDFMLLGLQQYSPNNSCVNSSGKDAKDIQKTCRAKKKRYERTGYSKKKKTLSKALLSVTTVQNQYIRMYKARIHYEAVIWRK